MSERRASQLVNISTSFFRYQPKRGKDDAVRKRHRELAEGRKWFSNPRLDILFTKPGKTIENAFTESLIGRLRDECLDTNWFINLKHSHDVIED